ncbi:MAG TPA: hypothetical protein VMH28_23360 [Candidatus Acidoferrales bacterium]|nr:hypothetical protein [Candidatus Acidoferrales bacterium]
MAFGRIGIGVLTLLFSIPAAAFADIVSTATLTVGQTLSLDKGTVASVAAQSGDLLLSSGTLTFQGSASGTVLGNGTLILYNVLTQQVLQGASTSFQQTAIPTGPLVANAAVIEVKTNGGNYAKLLLTAISSTSLTFQYTTYGASAAGGGGAPAVTAVQNNYSYIAQGLPNYGIAPGTLFIVKGTNLNSQPLSALQSSASPGLPQTFNGTSVSVTVNGTTVQPAIYYTSPTQLGLVLPSTTPVGTGTITVTNNGTASAPAQFVVVQSAMGMVVATDANYNYFSNSSSASPGQPVILWGSGVGADASNDDRTFPMKQNNLTSIPMTVYVGGIQAAIAYRGRSQFPGVDQIVVTIPNNVAAGCNVSIVTLSGNIVSNTIAIPVAQGGGACTDPSSAFGPAVSPPSGKNGYSTGVVTVLQSTGITRTSTVVGTTASADFVRVSGLTGTVGSGLPSVGSCTILVASNVQFQQTGLDAGSISVSGGGTQTNLQGVASQKGVYSATVSAVPATGQSYTFTGAGGADVGAFSTSINFPPPLVWTNQPSITSVNRAQGQLITWSGGAKGTYVQIGGQSAVSVGVGATFVCLAPVDDGQFMIPSWILLALPPNATGALNIFNLVYGPTYSVPSLDYAYSFTESLTDKVVAYQ